MPTADPFNATVLLAGQDLDANTVRIPLSLSFSMTDGFISLALLGLRSGSNMGLLQEERKINGTAQNFRRHRS